MRHSPAAGYLLIAGATPAASAASASGDASASAVIYWAFRNVLSGDCLTTYASGAIRMQPCAADAKAQEWHWINPDRTDGYRLLKNRWTGKCLRMEGREVRVGSYDCDVFGGNLSTMHWKTILMDGTRYRIRNAYASDYLQPGPDGVYVTHLPIGDSANWRIARRD
ncbi:hypothetical protein [Nonomuraea sp. B5E05]|uniref:hypothetical protein n=1 Tax=Nonomuraea sp. B5E05 TaxID=3153569 RepID=UPI0032617F88